LGTTDEYDFSGNISLTIPVPEESATTGTTYTPSFFDESSSTWSSNGISSVVFDSTNDTVTFNIDHLTDFAIVEEASGSTSVTGSGGGCLLKR
jgi:hypothetical protein